MSSVQQISILASLSRVLSWSFTSTVQSATLKFVMRDYKSSMWKNYKEVRFSINPYGIRALGTPQLVVFCVKQGNFCKQQITVCA